MKSSGVVRPLAAAAILALSLAPRSAPATQVVPRTVDEMGLSSERVVRGTVSSVDYRWNEAHTRILTETTVRVARDFKGAGPATVRIVQFGGVLDGVRMTVAGSLEWSVGEDVILFLEPSLPGRQRVAGFNQGKYTVERDPASGEEFVRPASVAALEPGGPPVDGPPDRMRLEELIDRALPDRRERRE